MVKTIKDCLETCKSCKATCAILILWTILFLLGIPADLATPFAGRGIGIIGHEYYRFFTGSLLHVNAAHLIANSIGIYWAGYFAERSVGSIRFFAFGMIASALAQCMYAFIRTNSESVGGSIWVFAYVGLILVFQFLKPRFPRFHLRTQYGEWILGYCFWGNFLPLSFIPIFSFMSVETVVIHLCALAAGCAAAAAGAFFKLL